jgi:hypothetical protein
VGYGPTTLPLRHFDDVVKIHMQNINIQTYLLFSYTKQHLWLCHSHCETLNRLTACLLDDDRVRTTNSVAKTEITRTLNSYIKQISGVLQILKLLADFCFTGRFLPLVCHGNFSPLSSLNENGL